MAEKKNVEVPDERGCGACCCFCCAQENTLYKPGTFFQMLGCMKTSVCLCCRSTSYSCIFPSHQAFDGLSEDFKKAHDEILCVINRSESALIKPLFLEGDLPIYKSVSKGCCCTERVSCGLDGDAPGRCALLCFYLGMQETSGCCPNVDPLSNKPFETSLESPWAGHGYTAGQEYVMCMTPCIPPPPFGGPFGPAPCTVTSLSIPEFAVDALGFEVDRQVCCVKCNCYGGLLPDKNHDEKEKEHLKLNHIVQTSCIKPKVCCKESVRCGFCHHRSSLPCDESVPLGCAIFGIKICTLAGGEELNFKSCHYGCSTKE